MLPSYPVVEGREANPSEMREQVSFEGARGLSALKKAAVLTHPDKQTWGMFSKLRALQRALQLSRIVQRIQPQCYGVDGAYLH